MADGLRLHKVAAESKYQGGPGPHPLAGIRIIGDPPHSPAPSTTVIDNGVREGWIIRENERPVTRPAGPRHAPLANTHSFVHADAVVFHTLDGDVRYRVVGQPDKYGPDGEPVESYDGIDDLGGCDVRWFYQLELED